MSDRLGPVPLTTRAGWEAAPRRDSPARTKAATAIVLHHTAGTRPSTRGAAMSTIRAVQTFHQNTKRWTDIAYNYLVTPDGELVEGRGDRFQNGANTPRNTDTLSVCLLGNMNRDPFTDAEKATVAAVAEHLGLPVVPHSDIGATACPGDAVRAWLDAGMPAGGPPIDDRDARVVAALEEAADAIALARSILGG